MQSLLDGLAGLSGESVSPLSPSASREIPSHLDNSRQLLVISDEADMLGALHERDESDGLRGERSAAARVWS